MTARTDPLELAIEVTPPRPVVAAPGPLAAEAYYGLAGEIVQAIEPHSEADPVAILATLLAMFGGAAGSSSCARVERDKHPPRLYFGLVGETAKARKGTSAGWPRYLLTRADPTLSERVIDGLSSGEGLIWQVRDPIAHVKNGEVVTADDGISDKRLMVLEGELARVLRVLGREGNTLSTVIRCAWDSGDLNSATKNNPARATGAHVSIVGHITQQELLTGLSETESANGFANRFMWLFVRRSKTLPFGGDLSDEALEPFITALQRALAFARQGYAMTWAPETRPLWASVYPELSEGKPGLIGALAARSEAQALRLAVTYALMDMSTTIRPEHLSAALALWEYAEASVRYLFAGRLGDLIAETILDELARIPGGLTRTQIRDLFDRNVTGAKIGAALDLLSAHGLAHVTKTGSGVGRPADRWYLGRGVTT